MLTVLNVVQTCRTFTIDSLALIIYFLILVGTRLIWRVNLRFALVKDANSKLR